MKRFSMFVFLVMLIAALAFISAKKESKNESKGEETSSQKVEHSMGHHKDMEKQEKKEVLGFDKEQKEGSEAVCPVTKEKFKITKGTPYSKYKDKYYYFCCDACKPAFDKDPEKYLK